MSGPSRNPRRLISVSVTMLLDALPFWPKQGGGFIHLSAEDILGIEEDEAPPAAETQSSSAYRFNAARTDSFSQSPSGRMRMSGGGNGKKRKGSKGSKSDGSTTDDEGGQQGSVTEVDEDDDDRDKVKVESPTGQPKMRGSLISEQDPIGDFDRLVARGGDVYSEIIDGS
jgi:hypothetical protein